MTTKQPERQNKEAKQPEQQNKETNPLEQQMQQLTQQVPALQQAEQTPVVRKGLYPLLQFLTKFQNDWTMNLQAGALAYNLLLALFPIAVALLSIFGFVLGSAGQNTQQAMFNVLQHVLPGQVGSQQNISSGVIQQISTNLQRASGPLGIIAFLFAVFGGSRLFILMENCFDLIYHQRPRPFLKQNIMAIEMLLLFAVLIPLIIFASSIPSGILTFLQQQTSLNQSPIGGILVSAVGILTSLLAAWILFEAIYIIVPNHKISFHDSWRGAVTAAIALQLYLTLFPLYVAHFLSSYIGQVGFAVILIVFFYYFAIIILLGAQVNAFFAEGVQRTPDNLAGLVHQETSHEPKPDEEKQEEAPPSHKPDKPKDA